MRYGIRGLVLFLALAPATLIAILDAAYLIQTRLWDQRKALDERGQALAQQLAGAAEYGLTAGNRRELAALAQRLLVEPDVASVRILDAVGADRIQVAQVGASTDEPVELRYYRSQVMRTGLAILDTELIPPGGQAVTPVLGEVEVGLSLASTQARQHQVMRHGGLLLLFGLMAAGALGGWLGNRLVFPIVQLERAVQRVQAGALTTRVDCQAAGELGRLQAGFNTMTAALAEARGELEDRIAAATLNLRQSLEALVAQNQELEQARRQTEAASRAKSEFLATISHEIRTPLHGMGGCIALLASSLLPPLQSDYLRLLRESMESLQGLLTDVLDFSKLEAGKLNLLPQPFMFRRELEQVVQLYQPEAERKGVQLRLDIDPMTPPRIIGDRQRLTQVIHNLLSNAVKFTHRGRIRVAVDALMPVPGACQLRLVVQDTGIGIPVTERDRIFDPFHQLDASTTRHYSGTGLGLSICRRLVELMQGTLTVMSDPSQGTTFTLTLPVTLPLDETEVSAPAPSTTWLERVIHEPRPDTPWRRLLVVDDNDLNRRLVEHVLGDLAVVDQASGGEEALHRCSVSVYSMILMDIRMPGLDGLEVTQRLRTWNGNPNQNVVVVALTADVTPETAARMRQTGIKNYLYKPLAPERLRAVVAEIIG